MNVAPGGSVADSGRITKLRMSSMKERSDRDADRERKQRADDALPELVEMLQKRHLSAFVVVVEPAVGHVAR